MESGSSLPKKREHALPGSPGLHSVEITIDDFISPTILERLKQQNKDNPLFQPQVGDWRSMVDSIMIDAEYDGEVFNIALADVPERKNDLVEGKYVVEAKKGATVAVKVTDMLGEEVLVLSQSPEHSDGSVDRPVVKEVEQETLGSLRRASINP